MKINFLKTISKNILLALGLLGINNFANAQLSIEITGAGANQIGIAVADFAGSTTPSSVITQTIHNDLQRSGLFNLLPTDGYYDYDENSQPNYKTWKSKNADALAVGSVSDAGNGKYIARYRLHDVPQESVLSGLEVSANQIRTAGHKIADDIYEKLTGQKGVFSTRIAYVMKSGGKYYLQIADADGESPVSALISNEPIISPTWSPDGNKLAYVSFEKKKPMIYVHHVSTGKRQILANFKGSNSAPAFSPDGSKVAIVLSKDGNSQIYTINANGGGLKRITNSRGIDTEPKFSPDGNFIYFTSDRGGSPQIYKTSANGGSATRITFEGNYNVSPRPSPDGKSLAFISRRNGRFYLASLDLASGQTQILNDTGKDESPSFAPNSQMILFASYNGGRGILSAVSADGRVKQKLSVPSGEIREPAWGPYRN